MSEQPRLSFGIKTIPQSTTYEEILRCWQEADAEPLLEHAWLWDHLVPFFGDPAQPMFEGWTLLGALAARTERLRMGLLVTSNQYRLPTVLAKIVATADAISGGRIDVGIGAGGSRQVGVPAEAEGYGFTMAGHGEAVERLSEACTILKRMWTEDVVDFEGRHYRLAGARCEPKPVQQPRPPLLVGGWGSRTLRVAAEHADLWNIPGPPHHDLALIREKTQLLHEHCAELGRDPGEIVRSVQTHVHRDDPAVTREALLALIEDGVTHLVLNLIGPPYPPARWLAEEIVEPVLAQVPPR